MSILKKVISLLLCVAMLIPVLASCDMGDSPNADNTPEQTQESAPEQTHSNTNPPEETTDETHDGNKPPEETTDGAHTDEKPSEEIPDSPQPHTHTPASAVTENYVDSSCTQIGSYDIVVYCSECQEEISRTQNTINKKSHQYNQKVTTSSYLKSEATYTSSAVYYYSCTCGQRGTNTFSHGNPLLNNLTPTYSYTADYSFYVVTGVTGSGTTLEIPSIYDGLRVVAIAENAFKNNTTLTKVTLPNTIETIGQNAFSGCTALSEINLPEESVSSIGAYAFAGCTALKTISIPSKVTVLSEGVFQGCTKLKTVQLSDGLKTISNLAFDGCTALSTISIPNTVTSLGNMAFRHAEALTTVKLSTSLTSIGNATFQYCKSLSSVELHNKITTIGNSAFSYCYGLKELRILGSISSWGNSTFYECTALENVYIEKSSTATVPSQNYIFYNAGTAGNGIAFSYTCNITLPELLFVPNGNNNLPKFSSRTAVHSYTTTWTNNTTHHWHACQNSGCSSVSGKVSHTFGEWIVDTPATCVSTGTRHHVCTVCNKSVSETIHASGHNYATEWTNDDTHHWHVCQTSGCSSVSGKVSHTFGEWIVDTPATCVSTGTRHHVCTVCNKSVSETISASHSWNSENTCTVCQTYKDNGVQFSFNTNSNTYSVSDYTGSQSTVIIPSKYKGYDVTSIGSFAFQHCSGLTSITIPGSVTSIGSYAFSHCSRLTSITISDSVTSIGSHAFWYCSGLTSITIPFVGATKDGTSNTHFGYIFGASSYSDNDEYVPTSLKTVVITGGTSIGSYAFYDCSGLTSITILDSVTSIGKGAFIGCSGLTSITIPDSVTSIGSYAFQYCRGLTSINFKGTETQWSNIDKGDSWNKNTGSYTITYNYTGE